MNIQIGCHLRCRRSMIFRKKNPSRYATILSANVDFHALHFSADIVFTRIVNIANITVETVDLDTANIVAVFATDALAKRPP
jgi:hypothetical protein